MAISERPASNLDIMSMWQTRRPVVHRASVAQRWYPESADEPCLKFIVRDLVLIENASLQDNPIEGLIKTTT